MFSKLVLVALVAVVSAAPERSYSPPNEYDSYSVEIPILKDDRHGPDAYGNYHFEYETANGITRHEEGAPEGDNGAVVMQGGWYFTFPDGTPAQVTFVADGAGFRPQSDLLPVPHPLPRHAIEQIKFALEQDASAAAGYRPYE